MRAVARRRWAPPPSSVLNRSHPGTQGLLAAVLCGYSQITDATGRYIVTRTGSGGGIEGTPVGRAPGSFTTSSYQGIGGGAPVVGALSEFSVVAGFVVRTAGAAASSRAIYGERGTSGNPLCDLGFNHSAWGDARLGIVYRDNAGTLLNSPGTTLVDDGKFHVAVMRRTSATTFDLWLDGVRDGDYTSASMTANFTPAGSHVNLIGRDINGTSQAFTGAIPFVYLYNRALGTAEIGELYDDPFGIFAA